MIQPAQQDFDLYIGGTWSQPFIFFDDQAQTAAHNFTGWTPQATLILFDETELDGTATVSTNQITAVFTSIQTAGLVEQNADFFLSMTQNGTNPVVKEFLVRGKMRIRRP